MNCLRIKITSLGTVDREDRMNNLSVLKEEKKDKNLI